VKSAIDAFFRVAIWIVVVGFFLVAHYGFGWTLWKTLGATAFLIFFYVP
jgi:hypothetical protein